MKLTHPKSKQTIEVEESAKDVYLSQGWQEQTAKPKASGSDKS